MKSIRNIKVRQLVDWKAALIAGLAGGLISFTTNVILSAWLLDSPWLLSRIISSILMGESVLPPPASFSWPVLLASLFIHLLLSLIFASLIAVVVHQWGIIISFIGGALMGLAFYAIAFYTFSILYPWFYTFRSWIFLVMYILYGAFTGSVYELLEVEKYMEIKGRFLMYGNNPSQSRLYPQQQRSGGCLRIGIALAVAAFAIISFLGSKTYNPVTEQDQYISITQEQEIALGIQAAPEMEAQFGGLEPDQDYQTIVQYVGNYIIENSEAAQSGYPFEFHVLADQKTVNAFALPGGQVYITRALIDKFETEGQVAGVLSHEIMHVLARHSAEQIAQSQLAEGLTGALVLATYDPNDPSSMRTAQVAMLISQLVQMKFGRDDEIAADTFGVDLMSQASYDPNQMVSVMKILEGSSSGAPIEFFSTHPSPENRIGRIQAAITEKYPSGVPAGMIQ